jgi:hypothetical protein
MSVIYSKKIRDKLNSISLTLLKEELKCCGFTFVRDGGFRTEDEPFKFSNYLFYKHHNNEMMVRIGYEKFPMMTDTDYDFPIFEICFCSKDETWWHDITPDFRENKWKKISKIYTN